MLGKKYVRIKLGSANTNKEKVIGPPNTHKEHVIGGMAH